MTTSNKDIALFMVSELEENVYLYQEEAVYKIEEKFGEDYVYYNRNGGQSISKGVLAEFRKLTPNVIWERGEKCWRLKQDDEDIAGRLTD
ncbi:conserved hypothetical protein [Vibrio crassostreae]|nr:conserved hypothetical protein [Vibrio crassostreae]